jgi:hypothetical protein
MEAACHRCGGSLVDSGIFCPHCGAPQLRVETAEEAGPQQVAVPQRTGGRELHAIRWKTAITSALLLAIPLGLLSSLLDFSLLLLLAGGFGVVALYRRRSQSGFTDGRAGWRIGAVAGLLTALIATALDAANLVFHRYFLHGAAKIDQQFQTIAQQMADSMQKSSAGSPPEVAQMSHTWALFWLSPDGHVAIQLLMALIMATGIVLFAAAGGALGGRFLAARERARRAF